MENLDLDVFEIQNVSQVEVNLARHCMRLLREVEFYYYADKENLLLLSKNSASKLFLIKLTDLFFRDVFFIM